jgi:hypothetical protein
MPGKRNARSRVRGSWAARLTGTAVAILLAGAGAAAYLILGGGRHHTPALPTRVLGTQAIGLADSPQPQPTGSSPATDTLLTSRSGLSFQNAGQATAEWTADQMAGGTYIFIYLPDGLCLGSARASAVSLQRCNLLAGQRWVREHPFLGASGLDYWQLRNLADGRCLTAAAVAGRGGAATETAPRLERCQASPGSGQLIAFLINS